MSQPQLSSPARPAAQSARSLPGLLGLVWQRFRYEQQSHVLRQRQRERLPGSEAAAEASLSTATGQTGRGWDGDRAHASGTGTAGYAAPAMRRGGRRKDRGAHASPDVDTGPNERVSSRRTAPAARNPARRLPRSIWALLPSQAFTTRRPGLRRSRLDAAAWPSPVHGISPAAAHFALLVSPCAWLQSELPAHPAPRAHPLSTSVPPPPPPPRHSLSPRPVKFSSSFLRLKIPILQRKAPPLCTQSQSNASPASPRPLHSMPCTWTQALRITKGKERGLSQVGIEKDNSFISWNTHFLLVQLLMRWEACFLYVPILLLPLGHCTVFTRLFMKTCYCEHKNISTRIIHLQVEKALLKMNSK